MLLQPKKRLHQLLPPNNLAAWLLAESSPLRAGFFTPVRLCFMINSADVIPMTCKQLLGSLSFSKASRTPKTRFMSWLVAIALSPLGMPLQAVAQQGPQLDLERIKISAGMHLITAQVAATPEQRQIGLMLRTDMPPQEGMIFLFEQSSQQCFWMKNTLLPLTAAFVADDGRIVNLVDMKPQTLDAHCSQEPVRYVLEMNQGWFAKKGIKSGSKLTSELFQRNR